MQSAAGGAHLLAFENLSIRTCTRGEDKASGHVLRKERAVKTLQIMTELVRTDFLLHRPPPCGVTFAAMDHRQIHPSQIRLAQVIMMFK
ncbi:hypothetical protein D3C76_1399340 [compost metagenome]